MKNKKLLMWIFPILFVSLVLSSVSSQAQEPIAVPTFHCMSLYWSPVGGGAEKNVLVSYKKTNDTVWMEGLPMRYNPISGTSLDKADYRGSVVHLTPGESYDFKLTLQGTPTTDSITQATWDENFPEGTIVNVSKKSTPLEVSSGGSAGAYKVYDGRNDTIDVNHNYQYCLKISASYIIVRNFVLKGAGAGTGTWPPIGAIQIEDGVHDIIIEGCDISDFGRPHAIPLLPNHGSDRDCGIFFKNGTGINIQRVIIQRNKIHHPTYTCNNSYQNGGTTYTHPEGPQGITMFNNKGNHVIRYNEFYSDMNHMCNDIISGGDNGSYEGVPGPDCDIYCNYLSHCWDNAVELEGGGQNVRCWNNYMTQAADVIGNAAVSIGPLYLWRNVVDKAEWTQDGEPGNFIKMGHAGDEKYMTGHMFIFNNTCFQTDGLGVGSGIGGGNRIIKHCVARNNIIQLRKLNGQCISASSTNIDNDFDYDLYNGSVPAGSEPNGLKQNPTYVPGAGYNSLNNTGNFQLSQSSKGYDAGVIIPNFTDGYMGSAPDRGAHENGWADFQYGVNAVFGEQTNTGIKPGSQIINPHNFPLHQNGPNPFNQRTQIVYDLAEAADVQLDVYGIQGSLIDRLVDARQGPGQYSVLWEANNESGTKVPGGLYLYKIHIIGKTHTYSQMRKMLFLK